MRVIHLSHIRVYIIATTMEYRTLKWTTQIHQTDFFLRAMPTAYWSSQARGPIGAATADLHHSSQQHRILNPLSRARDWTCVLMAIRFVSAEPRWELQVTRFLKNCYYSWLTMFCQFSAIQQSDAVINIHIPKNICSFSFIYFFIFSSFFFLSLLKILFSTMTILGDWI